MPTTTAEITWLLKAWGRGDAAALEPLALLVRGVRLTGVLALLGGALLRCLGAGRG